MAGNERSGRRPERPRTRAAEPLKRPAGLKPEDRWVWDQMIAGAEHLEATDLPMALYCCQLGGQFKRLMKAWQKCPGDSDLRLNATSTFAAFEKACYRLCIDPRSKRTLYGDPVAEEVNPLKEFGIVTA